MIIVNCEVSDCINNKNEICQKDVLNLVVSYGRSTDYTHEFQCDDREIATKAEDSE